MQLFLQALSLSLSSFLSTLNGQRALLRGIKFSRLLEQVWRKPKSFEGKVRSFVRSLFQLLSHIRASQVFSSKRKFAKIFPSLSHLHPLFFALDSQIYSQLDMLGQTCAQIQPTLAKFQSQRALSFICCLITYYQSAKPNIWPHPKIM